MKTILIHKMNKMSKLLFLFSIFFPNFLIGDNIEDFRINIDSIESQFSTVNHYISSIEPTEKQTLQMNNFMIEGSHFSFENRSKDKRIHEPILGIPSFMYGCFLGPFGSIFVAITTDNKQEKHEALYGCIANGIFVTALLFYSIIYQNNNSGCL